MAASSSSTRLKMISLTGESAASDLGEAVREGLAKAAKTLPCRFFYDRIGSCIFEEICELPEYYLTRAEHEILRRRAPEIAALFDGPATLVELGSGSSTKTRVLIEAFLKRHGALRYVPLDISRTMLEASACELLADYPGLEVVAIAAEYRRGLRRVDAEERSRKLILFLGSSVGNFSRPEAATFLGDVRATMREKDRLLIGIDLRKDRHVLERAYDDAAGTTARFNKNLLARINRELGADFDLEAFEHRAVFNEELGRVEMHLVSRRDQTVTIREMQETTRFDAGEVIHTESSYKYTTDEIAELAAAANMRVERQWFDDANRFSVSLLAPAC